MSGVGLSRHIRRRLRRDPAGAARAFAQAALYMGEDGRTHGVPRAAEVALRRGYKRMIEANFEPVTIEIGETEGRAFGFTGSPPPAARWWLACGLDVDGAPSFATTWSHCPDGDGGRATAGYDVERDEAEVTVLASLARVCNTSGLHVSPGPKCGGRFDA